MAETDDGIAEREELLDGEDLGTAERRELRREIRELVRDLARLEDHHHGLVHELSVRSESTATGPDPVNWDVPPRPGPCRTTPRAR